MVKSLGRAVRKFVTKLSIHLTYKLAILLLGLCPKEILISPKKTCARMSMVALF